MVHSINNNIAEWCLDRKHLMLCAPIIDSDKYDKFVKFDCLWHNIICVLAKHIEDRYGRSCNTLMELELEARNYFEQSFRQRGVRNYYKDKHGSIYFYAKHIRLLIDKDFQLDNISEVGDCEYLYDQGHSLLKTIKTESLDIASEKKLIEQQTIERKKDISETVSLFGKKNLLLRNIKWAETYRNYQSLLTDYFTAMTLIEAMDFAGHLLDRIIVEVEDLLQDMEYKKHYLIEKEENEKRKKETEEQKEKIRRARRSISNSCPDVQAHYLLLAMAMNILKRGIGLHGEARWYYVTYGRLPDGTTAKGVFNHSLPWLNYDNKYIYKDEIPENLWTCIKRDVEENIATNNGKEEWSSNIRERLSKVLEECLKEVNDPTELREQHFQAIKLLDNYKI